MEDEEIAAALAGDPSGFSPGEQALLRLADTLSGAPVNVSDELYDELRRHYSEEQLIELAAAAAQENARARWGRVFNMTSDALYFPHSKA